MTFDLDSQDDDTIVAASNVVVDQLQDLVSSRYLNVEAGDVQIRSSALFARLKALNRIANTATRVRKQTTTEARLEMDQTHLGLQNLLYEKRHLEREIDKCRQFGSIYQDIPYHSLEEFTQLAPAELCSEEVLQNEHQLMINRLTFELQERQRLDARKRELTQQKDELLRQSKGKLSTLDDVKAQIETLTKAAAEVQRKVDEIVQPITTTAA